MSEVPLQGVDFEDAIVKDVKRLKEATWDGLAGAVLDSVDVSGGSLGGKMLETQPQRGLLWGEPGKGADLPSANLHGAVVNDLVY